MKTFILGFGVNFQRYMQSKPRKLGTWLNRPEQLEGLNEPLHIVVLTHNIDLFPNYEEITAKLKHLSHFHKVTYEEVTQPLHHHKNLCL